MKDIYEFLDNVFDVVNNYFFFFYEKNVGHFESINPSTDEEYNNIKGESKPLKGREGEFKRIFHPLAKKNFEGDNNINVDSLIYEIEKGMLSTDEIGRKAIVRRIIKKAGKITCIGAYGFDEIEYGIVYALEHLQDNDLANSDNEISVANYCMYIGLSVNGFYLFLQDFKELCEDFAINFDEEVDRFGFDSLKELTSIGWRKRIELQDSKITKKGFTNEFTKNKKRIAIEAMLDALGVQSGKQNAVPLAEIHRFAHFLISEGNRAQPIDNTGTAKVFKSKPQNTKAQKEDNNFVADYFLRLGLDEISIKIKEGKYN